MARMRAFAGVIRHDGEAVPGEWLAAMAGADLSPRTIHCHAAAFVEYASGPCQAPAHSTHSEMASTGQPLFLVDARIDNARALPAQQGDAAADVDVDAAAVMAAYERWGAAFVEHLSGDFAIARWDPAQRQLLLARDAMGAFPIYFHAGDTFFAFATDLPALLALPSVPRALCEEAIADLLDRIDADNPARTVHASIHRLPAAHCLHLDGNRHRCTRHWNPDLVPAGTDTGDDGYANALRERIVAAVECRLQDARRPAVLLSGGIDSASIACIAARYLQPHGRRLLALCSMLPAGHAGPEKDEREHVHAVLAQEANIDVVWVEMPLDQDVFAAATAWFDILGEPLHTNVSHIEDRLAQAAREHGADVVLSGFGGDFFASVPAQGAIRELLHARLWRAAARQLRAERRTQGTSWARLILREVLVPNLPVALRRAWRTARQGPQARLGCVNPQFARTLAQAREGRDRRLPASYRLAYASTHELMRFIASPGHVEQPISSSARVFARRYAVALRFPLLDVRIVEFMLGVPVAQMRRDGWHRSLIRRAMRGILPEAIRMRRDKGGAFDPGIMSRIVAGRAALSAWASTDGDRPCWRYIDRSRYLAALAEVSSAPRAQWRQDTFNIVLMGGLIARFIDWHHDWHHDTAREVQ